MEVSIYSMIYSYIEWLKLIWFFKYKFSSYLKQRYGVSEKFKVLKLPHALQDDNISCGVFCIKVNLVKL
jgi:hypothetical protein